MKKSRTEVGDVDMRSDEHHQGSHASSANLIESAKPTTDNSPALQCWEMASPKCPDESRFVAGMKLLYEENGSLKTAIPIAYQSGADSQAGRNHVLRELVLQVTAKFAPN